VTAALLSGYAMLLGTVGAWLLRRSRWPDRAPRLGVLAWHALSASTLLAVLLAGAVLVIPESPLSLDLAELIQACALTLRGLYATPGGMPLSVAGAAFALAVVARLGYCAAAELAVAGRQQRRQREMLTIVGRRDQVLGATVVEHGTAAVYCLPGRPRRIVCTTAALQTLNAEQLRAALAHEQAHLRGRHHLITGGARALARAFPYVPAFRYAVGRRSGWSRWWPMTWRAVAAIGGPSPRPSSRSPKAPPRVAPSPPAGQRPSPGSGGSSTPRHLSAPPVSRRSSSRSRPCCSHRSSWPPHQP
jgi:Zn-dependent protease with chaperone function